MEVSDIEKVFARLEDLVIDLPRDASSLGPEYLMEQISLCRGYLNEVSVVLQRLLQKTTLTTLALERLEATFAIRSDELLVGDRRVTILPSLADRHAMVNSILAEDRRKISDLKLEIQGNTHVERVVKLRLKELDNTMSALRLQRSLLKDQIRTGSFYGDESSESRGGYGVDEMSGEALDAYLLDVALPNALLEAPPAEPPQAVEVEVLQEDLDALISEGGVDGTLPVASVESPPRKEKALPDSALSSEDLDQDIEGFLAQDFEDDLDSLLADI